MKDMHLYYLENKKHILEKQKLYRSSAKGTYFNVYGRAKRHNFPICSMKEFVSWYNQTKRVCYYCKIPESKLKFLSVSKLFKKRFTIDKKIPSLGYFPRNMVLSCIICNMIKSNYFSVDEMVSLAKDYIMPKWQKMLILKKK